MTVSEFDRILAGAQSADVVVSVDGKDSMVPFRLRDLVADWKTMREFIRDVSDGLHRDWDEARRLLNALRVKP